MKRRTILFVFNMFLLTLVFSQSQMLKGTVLPVSEEQGIIFLPLVEKVALPGKVNSLPFDTVPANLNRSSINKLVLTGVLDTNTTIKARIFPANYSLQSLDTVLMAKNAKAINLPVKSNLKGQTISGAILSGPGLSTVLEPLAFVTNSINTNEPTPSINHVTNTPVTSVPSVKPMDLLDTSKLNKKDFAESYSTPQEKSALLSQNIKGTFFSTRGSSNTIEPISPDSLAAKEMRNRIKVKEVKTTINENTDFFNPVIVPLVKRPYEYINTTIAVSPMDFLDTTETRRRDYISSYSTPPLKINLRSQNIIGSIISSRGVSTVIEPISADSLMVRETDRIYKLQMAASANASMERVTVSQQNVVASPSPTALDNSNFPVRNAYSPIPINENKKSNRIVSTLSASNSQKPAKLTSKQNSAVKKEYTIQTAVIPHLEITNNNDTKYNFFVNQFGKFSIRISSNYFYLNITQNGKLADYAILADGQVAGSNSHTTQLGKIKITFDKRGWIETIAGVDLAYTYDGRVNKVGNIYVNYDSEGKIIKVGTIDINFNNNSTVDKFANYRVGYIRRRVIGIDDSNGLVIYRPVVEDDNKPNF